MNVSTVDHEFNGSTKFFHLFPLLADTEMQMPDAYGAWGEKKNYGKVSMGTIRTTVVVGADGIVEDVYAMVKAKGHAEAVLGDIS